MKKDKKTREKGNSIINRESVGFTVGVFCILLFVMSVTKSLLFGSLGESIYQFQFGVFGFANYFVLLWLLFVCVRLVVGKDPVPIKHFTAFFAAFLFCLMLTVHAFATAGDATSYGEYIAAAFARGEFGAASSPFGAFGSIIVYPVRAALTAGGAYAVLLLLTIVSLLLTVRSVLVFRGVNVKIFGKNGLIARLQNRGEEKPTEGQAKENPLPDNTRAAYGEPSQTGAAYSQQPNNFRPAPVENYTDRRDDLLRPSYTPTGAQQAATARSEYDQSKQFLYGEQNDSDYRKRNLIFDQSSRYNNRNKNEAENGQPIPTYKAPAERSPMPKQPEPPADDSSYGDASYGDASYGSSVYTRMTSEAMDQDNTPAVQEKRVVDERRGGGYSVYQSGVYDTPNSSSDRSTRQDTFSSRAGSDVSNYGNTRDERTTPSNVAPTNDRQTPAYEERNETASSTDDYNYNYNDTPEEEQDVSPSRREDFHDRFVGNADGADMPETTNTDRNGNDIPDRTDRRDRANIFDDGISEIETEADEPLDSSPRDDRTTDRMTSDRMTTNRMPSDRMPSDRMGGGTERETSRRDITENTPKVVKEPPKPHIIKDYVRPSSDLLLTYEENVGISTEESENTQRAIIDTLAGFHINVTVKRVISGPVFTRYDINLPRSVDFGKIARYKREVAMAIRRGGTINIYPNYQEGSISIEVPNTKRSVVGLKPLLRSPAYQNAAAGSLMFAVGMDAEGNSIVEDLCKMPHMLVAGTTGSGKSVFLHEMIVSLIMKYSPEELRLILIDPKYTEFAVYKGLPHLMINEIIADAPQVVVALNWAIAEMQHRYTLFAQMQEKGMPVRNIDEYNSLVEKKEDKLPKIVIVADELADLMTAAKSDIENRVGRIAAKARAAGIHLVLATQRPSVNVITGVLKSNLSSRVALRVSAEVDSRVILDTTGAENLLGKGDLLYKTGSMYELKRVQSAWIDTPEIQKICDFIREHNESYYDEKVSDYIMSGGKKMDDPVGENGEEKSGVEPIYVDALRYVIQTGTASISMIQRRCSIGFNKAGKIVDWMEQNGYISSFDGGAKVRKVLLSKEEFEEKFGEL